MNNTLDKDLKNLKDYCMNAFNEQDKQTLFYFIQMIELMYKELSYEIYDKEKLYDLVCNVFKSNTSIVFSNMKDYYSKRVNSLINEFSKIVKVSVNNKYISSKNLSNIYNNFKAEIKMSMNLDNKIKVLSEANGNLLLEQIYTNCVSSNGKKVEVIVKKYVNSITEEMIKNVTSKNETLLNTYKRFIEEITEDFMIDNDKISNLNLKVITNTTYTCLKEQEYFVIEKYINENTKAINNFFDKVNNIKNIEIKKKSEKLNSAKDYLQGFNNTIRVKAKNIFDEMNMVVTLDEKTVHSKLKEYTDLISHIYELDIKFDKQLADYKKRFSVSAHNRDKFNKIYDKECDNLTKTIKLNTSNIFRENTKLYNDIVYKSIVLKSRIDEFNVVLSEDKVKDLLLK